MKGTEIRSGQLRLEDDALVFVLARDPWNVGMMDAWSVYRSRHTQKRFGSQSSYYLKSLELMSGPDERSEK